MAIEPLELLVERVEHRFARPVAVLFVRVHHQLDRAAQPLHRVVEPPRLDREGSRVRVRLAVE